MATFITRTASVEMMAILGELALTSSDDKQSTFEELDIRTIHPPRRCNDLRIVIAVPDDQSKTDEDSTCDGIFQRTRSASRQHPEHSQPLRGFVCLQGEGPDASLASPSRRRSAQVRFEPYSSPKARPATPKARDALARKVASLTSKWDGFLVERRLQQEAPRIGRWREGGTRVKPQSEI